MDKGRSTADDTAKSMKVRADWRSKFALLLG